MIYPLSYLPVLLSLKIDLKKNIVFFLVKSYKNKTKKFTKKNKPIFQNIFLALFGEKTKDIFFQGNFLTKNLSNLFLVLFLNDFFKFLNIKFKLCWLFHSLALIWPINLGIFLYTLVNSINQIKQNQETINHVYLSPLKNYCTNLIKNLSNALR